MQGTSRVVNAGRRYGAASNASRLTGVYLTKRANFNRPLSPLPAVSGAPKETNVPWPGPLSKAQQQLLIDGAKLSALAYREPSELQAQWYAVQDPKYQSPDDETQVLKSIQACPDFFKDDKSGGRVYVMRYTPPPEVGPLGADGKPVMAVVARGSEGALDWLQDCRFLQTAHETQFKDCASKVLPDVEVHRGFYCQFMGIFGQFDEQVKSHLAAGGQLVCFGHSLGSAVATLAALNYGSKYPTSVWYAGYGCPRVGNAAFRDAFNRSVVLGVRVKNNRDPVAEVPPPIDYCHVGVQVYLGVPDPTPLFSLTDIGDHMIDSYIRNMEHPMSVKPSSGGKSREWLEAKMDAFRSPAASTVTASEAKPSLVAQGRDWLEHMLGAFKPSKGPTSNVTAK